MLFTLKAPPPAAGSPNTSLHRLLTFSFQSVWRATTLLLMLVAFGALAVTGEVSGMACLLFVAAWIAAVFVRSTPRWWNNWMGAFLTLAMIAYLALLARSVFFTSVLYLLLYLSIVKCFTLRKPGDYLQAQILAFFMIVSTAVITVNFHFLVFFLGYILLSTFALALFGIALQSERIKTKRAAPEETTRLRATGALPGRFLASGWVMPALVLIFLPIFFLFIPHFSTNQLDAPLSSARSSQETLTGFSEEVTLGSFKQIKPDSTVVMRIELNWPAGAADVQPPNYLRVRGVTLDYYDQRRWRRAARPNKPLRTTELRQINFSFQTAQRGRYTIQKFYQNAAVTSRLFAGSMPMEIDLGRTMKVRFDEETGSAQISAYGGGREDSFSDPLVYTVTSNLVEEASWVLDSFVQQEKEKRVVLAERLQHLNDSKDWLREMVQTRKNDSRKSRLEDFNSYAGLNHLAPEERLINTQLPQSDLIDRISKLAHEVAKGPTREEMMLQLIKHLRNNYQYSLEQNLKPEADPIRSFLFETRMGHCEYFATSLVLMLRSLGIPARLANGFYSTDWNPLARIFIVKQSDAHTWVEAWSDELGWLTLDPTPPGSAGRGAYGTQALSYFSSFSEYMRVQWQRYVIDYSAPRQAAFFNALRERAGIERILQAVSELPGRLQRGEILRAPKQSQGAETEKSWTDWIVRLLSLLLVFLLAARLSLFFKRWRIRRKFRSPVDFLNFLLQKLESLGWVRLAGQTPLEFVSRLKAAGAESPDLDWLIGLYNRARFAGESPKSDEAQRAFEVIRSLQIPKNAQ